MAGFNFGNPTSTTASSFSLGNNMATGVTSGFNFGSASNTAQTPGSVTFGTTTSGLGFGTPAANQAASSAKTSSAFGFGTTTQPLTFGSKPAASQSVTFGSTPTTQPLSFGNTPNTQSLTFGSSSTTQPMAFGCTPITQPLTFGSTPTTQPLTFGNTPTTQPLTFGGTATTTQPIKFGSTGTSQPLNFGVTPSSAQPLTSGNTPSLGFGSTPTTKPTVSFGLSTPTTTTNTGFPLSTTTTTGVSSGLGSQPATTKPLSFGTSTTLTPLLNLSIPKTTATPGFSLTVSSGTVSGSQFTPATSAAPIFKGLGGIDSSANQGSGSKDVKSVKENIVDSVIVQTLDVFKNFVKQQKNLGCEVSRAPVKPMHKVTEDSDALNKLLKSVSSALQKNKVITNKLKTDTTKCLSLCEMAQRTHDTPMGLQNDNVAPLEFFIQLVSKFERDIHVLRQEIDNTEKHVNSLSYPAILTPQELSIALRRLHDSFVALAGRLQPTHVAVIAQKERHLSLRRHFLKDHTNIFDSPSRTAKKPMICAVGLPKPGPTPFSSMGGIQEMTFVSGQEKHGLFSTGPTSLTGWAASPNTSTLFQSPSQSPATDNQNFQLGKPPVGNKRGKR